jgi:(2Fe-2S) ferredoxin
VKTYRLAVCKGPNCREGGADQVFAACRDLVSKGGMTGLCEVYRAGCYGLCHLGPNIVLRENPRPKDPLRREDFHLTGLAGEFHYPAMTVPKMVRVVEEHVAQGRVPEELLGRLEDGLCSPQE